MVIEISVTLKDLEETGVVDRIIFNSPTWLLLKNWVLENE
jgi:DNA-binding HxlR family transcriptional regulator